MINSINLNFSDDLSYIAGIVKKRISDRSNIKFNYNTDSDYNITIILDETLPCHYRIVKEQKGVEITGSSFCNLIAGCGKWLHNTKYRADFIIPSEIVGDFTGKCEVRGMYYAMHFYNFYQLADESHIREATEDLALWGFNYISTLLPPLINLFSKEDPNAPVLRAQSERIQKIAKSLGMKFNVGYVLNADFKNQREDVKAEPNYDPHERRGNNGENICPSKPGALEYIKSNWEWLLDNYNTEDVDMFGTNLYDEGGCGCPDCLPYGSNGFVKLWEYVKDTIKSKLPNAKFSLSTWMLYDDIPEEWEGLIDYLNKSGEFDYLTINTEYWFQKYPLTHKLPRKLLNFPEISMWGMFPWGAYGANPIPKHLAKVLKEEKDIISGGFPYSEGIAEDINKVLISELYFNGSVDFDNVLSEYINFEFSDEVIKDVKALIENIEYNQDQKLMEQTGVCDWSKVENAEILAEKINSHPSLRKDNWRWRILYIRAKLERERLGYVLKFIHPHKAPWSEEAKVLMEELNDIYQYTGHYIGIPSDNHSWVAPPLWQEMYHMPPI